jgi:hypothetical protein
MGLKTKARDNKVAGFKGLVAEGLRPCVAVLTGSDEVRRQRAVAIVLEVAEPPLLRLLIDQLVRRLAGRDGPTGRQAARSLADLGEPAVPALNCALLKSHGVKVQVLLVEALTAIAKTLPLPQRAQIQMKLAIAQARTTSPEVAAAVARADGEFRQPCAGRDRTTAPTEVLPGRSGRGE